MGSVAVSHNTMTFELCNTSRSRCLHSDTLIVLCYALFCICFGFVVALLVIFADKRREKNSKTKKDDGKEHVETSEAPNPVSWQQSELEEVYRTMTKIENVGKFTGKLEDMLDSPTMPRRGSTASARLRQDVKTKQVTSPLAAELV